MTLFVGVDGGKAHIPAWIDHKRDTAKAACGRVTASPVEADPDASEVCEDCREARPGYLVLDTDT